MDQKNITTHDVYNAITNHKKRRRGIVVAVSILLVLTVVTLLILPAIAMENTVYCDMEEHQHSESCYETRIVCGLEEDENHQHSKECYDSVLICDKEEHTHTLACHSNPDADKESAEDWEASFEYVDMTLSAPEILAAIAKSQLGYRESEDNYVVENVDDQEIKRGYTRYGEWYGEPYEKWNSIFAMFCLNYAGIKDYPRNLSVDEWVKLLDQAELFVAANEEAKLQKGMLVFLDTDDDGVADSVSILTDVLDNADSETETPVQIETVEGIVSKGVEQVIRDADDKAVIGFGVLPEHKEQQEEQENEHLVFSAVTDTDVLVTVKADTDSFESEPDSLSLTADEIVSKDFDENISGYINALKSKTEVKNMNNAVVRVFDIALKDSQIEIVPQKEVELTLGGLDSSTEKMVFALRDESAERVETISAEEEASDTSVSIHTQELGRFIVIYDQPVQQEATVARRSVQNLAASGAGTTYLTVSKEWSDGLALHSGDSVVIRLMKNGVDTGRTATLSAANNWRYSFENIDKPDPGENFAYTVIEENPMEGYLVSYSGIEKITSGGSGSSSGSTTTLWVPANPQTLQSNKTYALVSNDFFLAQINSTLVSENVSYNGPVTINGTYYNNSISSVPSNSQWTTKTQNSKTIMSNNGNYIALGKELVSYDYVAASVVLNSNQKLSSTVNTVTGYYSIETNGRVTYSTVFGADNSATTFTLYEQKSGSTGGGTSGEEHYETSITNRKISDAPSQGESDLLLKKTIDYLGDGGSNPDTSLRDENAYRVYMEAKGYTKPVDMLIVADGSNSMNIEYDMLGRQRMEAQDSVINGTITSYHNGETPYGRKNADRAFDGIIANFMSANAENKLALTVFSEDKTNDKSTYENTKDVSNPITRNWSSLADIPNNGANGKDFFTLIETTHLGNTNYSTALCRAREMLADSRIVNDGRKKVMVFITDGEPNRTLNDSGRISKNDVIKRTRKHFIAFAEDHPDLEIFIVGVSKGANSGAAYDNLTTIASSIGASYYITDDAERLRDSLLNIIEHCTNVEVTDELSEYVEFNAEQPDLVVRMTDSFGNVKTLWRNGSETSDNYFDGARIITSCGFEEVQGSNGKVVLKLNPAFRLNGNNTFNISYNVKATERAKAEYADSGYPHTGDAGTDYPGNTTSSGKEGFRSNKQAYAVFNYHENEFTKYYDHPVVQVKIKEFNVNLFKIDSYSENPLEGAAFDIYRVAQDPSESGLVEIPGSDLRGMKLSIDNLESGSDGIISIEKLVPGDYVLVETSSPKGYALLTDVVKFTIGNDGLESAENASIDDDHRIVIENEVSYELPHTGGVGRTGFIVTGISLLMLSLVGIYIKRKRGGFGK